KRRERLEQVMGVELQQHVAQALGLVVAAAREGRLGGQHQEAVAKLGLALPVVPVGQVSVDGNDLVNGCHASLCSKTIWACLWLPAALGALVRAHPSSLQ